MTNTWLVTTKPPRWNGDTCGHYNGPVQRHIHTDPNNNILWACACGKTSTLQTPQNKQEHPQPEN